MRTVVIEEVTNGYVLRHRMGEETAALAFSGDDSLKKVLSSVKAFFLAPIEDENQTPSFGMLPVLKVDDTGALEHKTVVMTRTKKKTAKHRTPLPTESHLPRTQNDIPTVSMCLNIEHPEEELDFPT